MSDQMLGLLPTMLVQCLTHGGQSGRLGLLLDGRQIVPVAMRGWGHCFLGHGWGAFGVDVRQVGYLCHLERTCESERPLLGWSRPSFDHLSSAHLRGPLALGAAECPPEWVGTY